MWVNVAHFYPHVKSPQPVEIAPPWRPGTVSLARAACPPPQEPVFKDQWLLVAMQTTDHHRAGWEGTRRLAANGAIDVLRAAFPLAVPNHKREELMRSVRLLSTVAAVGTFLVIVFGKIVRVTGASTSIPDWPLAFGRLVPQMTPLVFWEWSHRLLVLVVFITVAALIVRAFWLPGRLRLYCSMSLGLLVITAVIGGLSILHPMHWAYAALDQAFAMLFFASVVGLAVWSHLVELDAQGRPVPRRNKPPSS